MSIIAIEALVENGQIRLPESMRLPEKTKVYVIVPQGETIKPARLMSPRLANPADAALFVKEVTEERDDAIV